MSEVGTGCFFVFIQFQLVYIGFGELRKTKQLRSSGFSWRVDSRNSEPVTPIFFYQEKVVIVVIYVEEKAVISKVPAAAGEDRAFRTL